MYLILIRTYDMPVAEQIKVYTILLSKVKHSEYLKPYLKKKVIVEVNNPQITRILQMN